MSNAARPTHGAVPPTHGFAYDDLVGYLGQLLLDQGNVLGRCDDVHILNGNQRQHSIYGLLSIVRSPNSFRNCFGRSGVLSG